jgi:uncharacterized membrane protein YphA (DoxX/SURF4 family)
MKTLRNISRIAIGLVFLFSGFVKAVDPMGSKFKFDDYFMAFGMEWLIPFSLVFGILLSTLEFVTGFCLISNLFTKFFSWVTLLFMLFFTVLTYILALTNPVTDCGCFGDAILLTNWETFYKNLFFMLPTIILFLERKKFQGRFGVLGSGFQTAFIALVTLYISFYSLNNLPLVDYRPYRVGQNLVLNAKEHPSGAPQAKFETNLLYEKNGERKMFELANLPDSTWQWVETLNHQISEGYVPPVKNLYLTDIQGTNYTDFIFRRDEQVLISVVLDMSKLTQEQITMYNEISVQCLTNEIYFVLLTSTNQDFIMRFREQHLPTYKILNADPITLKTIIRSDGGFLLTYKGTVLKKWHHTKFPDVLKVNEHLMITEAAKTGNPSPLHATFSYLILFLFLALLFDWIGLHLNKQKLL